MSRELTAIGRLLAGRTPSRSQEDPDFVLGLLERIEELEQRLRARASADVPPRDQQPAVLKDRIRSLLEERHDFKPGQLVRWKKGLKNRRRPDYDQPGVVVAVLDEPLYDASVGGGSPYFREPLDLAIGLIDEDDGEFIAYHYDRRRFELVE